MTEQQELWLYKAYDAEMQLHDGIASGDPLIIVINLRQNGLQVYSLDKLDPDSDFAKRMIALDKKLGRFISKRDTIKGVPDAVSMARTADTIRDRYQESRFFFLIVLSCLISMFVLVGIVYLITKFVG